MANLLIYQCDPRRRQEAPPGIRGTLSATQKAGISPGLRLGSVLFSENEVAGVQARLGEVLQDDHVRTGQANFDIVADLHGLAEN